MAVMRRHFNHAPARRDRLEKLKKWVLLRTILRAAITSVGGGTYPLAEIVARLTKKQIRFYFDGHDQKLTDK